MTLPQCLLKNINFSRSLSPRTSGSAIHHTRLMRRRSRRQQLVEEPKGLSRNSKMEWIISWNMIVPFLQPSLSVLATYSISSTRWSGIHPYPVRIYYTLRVSTVTQLFFPGGEHQRLVASRTFMRIASNKIKLVMVDEPTSAMDPEGELHLFDGLRQMREGKTMIFVTHRFGNLTKHADLILWVSLFPVLLYPFWC